MIIAKWIYRKLAAWLPKNWLSTKRIAILWGEDEEEEDPEYEL